MKRCSSRKALQRARSNVVQCSFVSLWAWGCHEVTKEPTAHRPPSTKLWGHTWAAPQRGSQVNKHFLRYSRTVAELDRDTCMHQEGSREFFHLIMRACEVFLKRIVILQLFWACDIHFSLSKMKSVWYLLLQSYEQDACQIGLKRKKKKNIRCWQGCGEMNILRNCRTRRGCNFLHPFWELLAICVKSLKEYSYPWAS